MIEISILFIYTFLYSIILFTYKYHDNEKMTQFEEEKREKSAHFIVWTRKSTQKKPPYKPSGLYRGENKRKIYINRMSDLLHIKGGCLLL